MSGQGRRPAKLGLIILLSLVLADAVNAEGTEIQLTSTAWNHELDKNDNFSPDSAGVARVVSAWAMDRVQPACRVGTGRI